MSDPPRKPLDYETPETKRRRPTRRNPREELVWAFSRGSAIGTAATLLALSIATGQVSDIPAGFACTILGATVIIATVSSFVVFIALELTWRFAHEDPDLRPPAAAMWTGMAAGALAIAAGAWSGLRGGDLPYILTWAGIAVLVTAAFTGWWLVIRCESSD